MAWYAKLSNEEMAEYVGKRIAVLEIGIFIAIHPIEYARTLAQLGYEPIPPKPPSRDLPNMFQFAKYIYARDGFFGCFSGLTPRLLEIILWPLAGNRISDYLEVPNSPPGEDLDKAFFMDLKRSMVSCIMGGLVSYPFRVIGIRMMAQFIGEEKYYSSTLASMTEIMRFEGIHGFYSGFIPKLIYDLSVVTVSHGLLYAVNKYISDTRQTTLGLVISCIIQMFVSSIMYPYQLVSVCMAVVGSRLKAVNLVNCVDWFDCYQRLAKSGELRRGGGLFHRKAENSLSLKSLSFVSK